MFSQMFSKLFRTSTSTSNNTNTTSQRNSHSSNYKHNHDFNRPPIYSVPTISSCFQQSDHEAGTHSASATTVFNDDRIDNAKCMSSVSPSFSSSSSTTSTSSAASSNEHKHAVVGSSASYRRSSTNGKTSSQVKIDSSLKQIYIAPHCIRYTNSTLDDTIYRIDEDSLNDIATEILESENTPPKLQIVFYSGQYFAINNSHLQIYKQLQTSGLITHVQADVISVEAIPFALRQHLLQTPYNLSMSSNGDGEYSAEDVDDDDHDDDDDDVDVDDECCQDMSIFDNSYRMNDSSSRRSKASRKNNISSSSAATTTSPHIIDILSAENLNVLEKEMLVDETYEFGACENCVDEDEDEDDDEENKNEHSKSAESKAAIYAHGYLDEYDEDDYEKNEHYYVDQNGNGQQDDDDDDDDYYDDNDDNQRAYCQDRHHHGHAYDYDDDQYDDDDDDDDDDYDEDDKELAGDNLRAHGIYEMNTISSTISKKDTKSNFKLNLNKKVIQSNLTSQPKRVRDDNLTFRFKLDNKYPVGLVDKQEENGDVKSDSLLVDNSTVNITTAAAAASIDIDEDDDDYQNDSIKTKSAYQAIKNPQSPVLTRKTSNRSDRSSTIENDEVDLSPLSLNKSKLELESLLVKNQ